MNSTFLRGIAINLAIILGGFLVPMLSITRIACDYRHAQRSASLLDWLLQEAGELVRLVREGNRDYTRRFDIELYSILKAVFERTRDPLPRAVARFARDSADLGFEESRGRRWSPGRIALATSEGLLESVEHMQSGDLVEALRVMDALYAVSKGYGATLGEARNLQRSAVRTCQGLSTLLRRYAAAILDGRVTELKDAVESAIDNDMLSLSPSVAYEPWSLLLIFLLRMQLSVALESRRRRSGNWLWMNDTQAVGFRLLQAAAALDRGDDGGIVIVIKHSFSEMRVPRFLNPHAGRKLPSFLRRMVVPILDIPREFPADYASISYDSVLWRAIS